MAITTINVGSNPNDGSGDSIRVAFQKANDNFTQLQTQIGNLATGTGTSGLRVNGPVDITLPLASQANFTGTFRIRATALDPYSEIATKNDTFAGGPVAGSTQFQSVTESTSVTTGAVTIAGGLGVGGRATIDNAVINGNIAVVNLNLTAGGQITLPDGSPFSYDVIANAASQADQIASKAPLNSPGLTGTPTAPTAAVGTNSTQIATTAFVYEANTGVLSRAVYLTDVISANLGAYQSWANLTLSTVANAVNQQQNIDSLIQANAATQANLGAYQTYANTTVSTITANLGAYQVWANLTLSTVANAVNQQENIDSLIQANAATQANIGAYQTYANANLATLFNGNLTTNANLGAYQAWANLALAPLSSPAFTGVPTADTAAAGTNTTQIATTAFVYEANVGLRANVDSNIGQLRYDLVTNYAPLASPALTGTPTAVTASPGDNSTSIATTGFVYEANVGLQANVDSNIGQLRYDLVTNYAPLVDPEFTSNVDVTSTGNLFVNGAPATFTNDVSVAAGGAFYLRSGAGASLFGMGNVTVWRSTVPSSSVGDSGDFPGILVYNSAPTPTLYVCFGDYDGSATIWGKITVDLTAF